MGYRIDSIKPGRYITHQSPRIEPKKTISSWFLEEKLEIDFGDYVGRPSQNVMLQKEYITRFLENGWTISSVTSKSEGGVWQTSNSTTSSQTHAQSLVEQNDEAQGSQTTSSGSNQSEATTNVTSGVTQRSYSSSSESSSTSSGSGGSSSQSSSSASSSLGSDTTSSTDSTTSGSTSETSESTGTVSTKGKTESAENTNSVSTSTVSGETYWYAVQHVVMKRRRLQPEYVMQSMTDSFTEAYNNGRAIDNTRFDELVSVYGVVLENNEKEANTLLTDVINATNPTYFLDKLYSSTWGDFNAAHKRAVEIATLSEKDAKADVNRQFDTLLATTKAQMITNGTYNTTVWPSVAAGIERQRAAALAKAASEAKQIAVTALTSVGSAKASAASAFLEAQRAIQAAIDNRRVTASEMRNTVVKWMLDFIGSREEVYPELEEISSIAERLGFSVGSAGNVL